MTSPAPAPTTLGELRAGGHQQKSVKAELRDNRYAEKLATPDVSVGDLIGDVDPIKVAEGRLLGDPETVHFGLVPRTNRGIVAVNELPDLAERIQVALLNVLEERDIQVRGYQLRLPLDLLLVASANPEDYTNRGRIITPLKDRFVAEARTHYPLELADADDGREFEVLAHLMRRASAETYRARLAGLDLRPLQEKFDGGLTVLTGDSASAESLLGQIGPVPVLSALLDRLEPDGIG